MMLDHEPILKLNSCVFVFDMQEDMADVSDESKEEYRDIDNKTFTSEADRYQFYNRYALEKGFSVRRNYVEWDGANKEIVLRKLEGRREGHCQVPGFT
jgi:zinc finger SWIM domain-containing protein 3